MDLKSILNAARYLKGGADKALGFVAPALPKTYNMAGNIGGALVDYIKYNAAKDTAGKQEAARSFTTRRNAAEKTLSEFGLGDGAFNPVKYGAKSLEGAAQLAAITAPLSKAISLPSKAITQAAKIGYNAIPSTIESAASGDNMQTIALKTALAGLGGRAGEKLGDVGSGAVKLLGGTLKNKGAKIGLDILGLTSKDVADIEKKLGRPVSQVLDQHNLKFKGLDDVQALGARYQNEFDSVANDPSLILSKSDVLSSFNKKIDPLKASNFSENMRSSEAVNDYVSRLTKSPNVSNATPLSSTSDMLFSGSGLTKERKMADDLVKTFKNTDANKSVNQHIREGLQNAIRDKADNLGLKTASGDSLKSVGGKLNDIYSITDIAEKRQGKSRALYNLLASSIGSGLGGLLGGPVGFAAGMTAAPLAREVLTTPAASRAIAGGLEGLGKGIQGVGSAASLLTPLERTLGQRLGTSMSPQGGIPAEPQTPVDQNNIDPAAATPQQEVPQQAEQFDPNEEITTLDGQKVRLEDHMNSVKQWQAEQGAGQVEGAATGELSQDMLKKLMVSDLLKNNGKNIPNLEKLNKILYPESDAKSKPLSAEAAKNLSRNQTAEKSIAQLEGLLFDDKGNIKQEGMNQVTLSALPGSLGARNYRSLWGGIIDAIGTNRTGAAYTADQRKDYAHLLPVLGDSDEDVKLKMARLKDEIRTYVNNVTNSGGETDQLLEVLGAQQNYGK